VTTGAAANLLFPGLSHHCPAPPSPWAPQGNKVHTGHTSCSAHLAQKQLVLHSQQLLTAHQVWQVWDQYIPGHPAPVMQEPVNTPHPGCSEQ
jgi:hypothetical protein